MTFLDVGEVLTGVVAILVLAASITAAVAPRIEALADDTTDAAAEVPDLPQPVDDGPSEVDPTSTLREERIVILAEPSLETVGGGSPNGGDWSATRIGNTWVHRSCNDARRDGQPRRVCAYCSPRLAGIPTTGGTR